MRAEGYAVESILRVLRQQGLEIAARTYRAWKRPARIASRTVTDALVEDKIRELAWKFNPVTGQVQMTPEGLYGRRKWLAVIRRQEGLVGASRGAVDRAMRTLGLEGVRRVKKIRTTIPGPDGKRAGDLLNRDFTAPAPDRVWVTDFTYVRTWAGFVYVAFVLDVFAQRIVGWHASSSMRTDLVMTPLRIALWQRDREGNPVSPGDLIHHSDAGAQAVFNRSSQHRQREVFDGLQQHAKARARVSRADRLAGQADGRVARGPCPILGRDRRGEENARVRCRCGRVRASRSSLVPECWRRESSTPAQGIRALSLVSRA